LEDNAGEFEIVETDDEYEYEEEILSESDWEFEEESIIDEE
jgi:hypothetical protein